MDLLCSETSMLIEKIHFGLADMERSSTPEEAREKHDQLRLQLDTISENCDRLDGLASRVPPHQRSNAKYRVDQLQYDHQHLLAALSALNSKLSQRHSAQQQRNELLQRKFTANESTSIHLDDAQHNQRLGNAHQQLDDMIDHGRNVLGNLQAQGMSLKDVKRKILNVGNQLGLSSTLLRMIESRDRNDQYMLFAGMIVCCLIMFLIYYWLRW